MRNESWQQRRMLKGYMFEVIILKLLERNGFRLISLGTDQKVRENRSNFIELKGRGGWHQIDCPCDYDQIIPFMYPIRLLGEVKYYSKRISKEKIREFIGVIKDIQENYIVPDNYDDTFHRVSELGVFFAAKGFDKHAERLAFAHNIKTISYENNYVIDQIIVIIEELELNYFSARNCISSGNLNDFIESFSNLLNGFDTTISIFRSRFNPSNGFEQPLMNLINLFREINSSFVASTSAGVFLHFVGFDYFPEELFEHTDDRICRVYYHDTNFGREYYLKFVDDRQDRMFYFTPPLSLRRAAFYGGNTILNEKERIFKTIHISMRLNGINRNLVLKMDQDWLESLRDRGA